MNKFINTIKYPVFALVIVFIFSVFANHANAAWRETSGDVFYDVVSVEVNAGPDKNYSLAAGATTKPSVTLTTNDTVGVYVKDDQNIVVSTAWTKVSGPTIPAVTITNGTTLTPTFGNLSDSTAGYTQNRYVFKLTAFDKDGVVVGEDTMTVSMRRESPKALAEEDKQIVLGEDVTLYGTRSKDMDAVGGGIATYEWTRVSGGGTIVSPNTATTIVRDLPVGRNVFRLRVVDLDGLADSTSPTVEGADADSPFTDDITITVVSEDLSVWLDILPDSCEISAGQTSCMLDSIASWGARGATTARFFRESDNQTLSTALNSSNFRINEYVDYPSKSFKIVANDTDVNTAEVSATESVYARCGTGYVWGGTTSGCIVDPSRVNGVCNNSVQNGCSAGDLLVGTGSTWICEGRNGGTDSPTCSYTGGGSGIYECNDNIDNSDPDTLIDEDDPSCHSNCNANDASSYVPTDDENKICLKPIYKQF